MGFLRWSRSQLLWLFIKHPHWQVLSTRQATGNCRCPQWFCQLKVLCLNLSYRSFLRCYLTFFLTFCLAWIVSSDCYKSSWSACKRQTHSSLACQGLKVWSLSWSAVDFIQIKELQVRWKLILEHWHSKLIGCKPQPSTRNGHRSPLYNLGAPRMIL